MKKERPEQQATTSSGGFRESNRVRILSLNFQVVPYCHCPKGGIQPQPSTPVAVDLPVVADGWWEVEQAAAYLNLTPKTVREGAAKGTLPGHKYPAGSRRGRWRFRKSELDKVLTKPSRQRRTVEPSVWN